MTLPAPVKRTPLHRRIIDCAGYEREDGLWEIEGRLTDTKDYGFRNEWRGTIAPGVPLHDMLVRLTLDDEMTVIDIAVDMAATPFEICSAIAPDFGKLKGVRIVSGWNLRLVSLFGGRAGCTHVVELLGRMGTVAWQTIPAGRGRRQALAEGKEPQATQWRGEGRPFYLNGCHAWASNGPLVEKVLPEYYEGPDNPGDRK
jgi:hypothetical protein